MHERAERIETLIMDNLRKEYEQWMADKKRRCPVYHKGILLIGGHRHLF